jgi:hypothetical protein
MAYQGNIPNTLMNIQRHLNHKMEFKRTSNGNPYFSYKGKNIMFNKKNGFMIHLSNGEAIYTHDFWHALEVMR